MNIGQFINGSSLLEQLGDGDFNIHIKIKQRNGRKSWTFVEGLVKLNEEEGKENEMFMEELAKKLKHKFNCGASISKEDLSLKMMGDHREGIKEYILKNFNIKEDQIKIHGF